MDNTLPVAVVVLVALLGIIVVYYVTKFKYERSFRQWQETERQKWEEEKSKVRKEAITQSRSVLGGKFVEQMAPYLPDFKYDPTEARFIGSPIDLIVFPGLATGNPREIVIMEIKSGKSGQLTPPEDKIRQLIEDGMVRWELMHVAPGGETLNPDV